jgi:hypothetical protein
LGTGTCIPPFHVPYLLMEQRLNESLAGTALGLGLAIAGNVALKVSPLSTSLFVAGLATVVLVALGGAIGISLVRRGPRVATTVMSGDDGHLL